MADQTSENSPLYPDAEARVRRQICAERLGLEIPDMRIEREPREDSYSSSYQVGADEQGKFIQVSHSVYWHQRSFMLCGDPGLGKTSFAEQVAALRGAALVEISVTPEDGFELLTIHNRNYQTTVMVRDGVTAELMAAISQDCVILIHDDDGAMVSEVKTLEGILSEGFHGEAAQMMHIAGQLVPINRDCLIFFEVSELGNHPYGSLPLMFIEPGQEAASTED